MEPAFPGEACTENGSSETCADAPRSPRPKWTADPGPGSPDGDGGSPDGGHGAAALSGPCLSPRSPAWVHEATRTRLLLGAEVYFSRYKISTPRKERGGAPPPNRPSLLPFEPVGRHDNIPLPPAPDPPGVPTPPCYRPDGTVRGVPGLLPARFGDRGSVTRGAPPCCWPNPAAVTRVRGGNSAAGSPTPQGSPTSEESHPRRVGRVGSYFSRYGEIWRSCRGKRQSRSLSNAAPEECFSTL